MVRKLSYIFLFILLLLIIAASVMIRKFNQACFRERPNHLVYTIDTMPVSFQWAQRTYGDYVEPHEAIVILSKIEGFSQQFYWQLDTGAPTTMIYGNILQSLKEQGVSLELKVKGDDRFVQHIDFDLSGVKVQTSMVEVLENYGSSFDLNDTIKAIKMGTIGADFLLDRITLIDFYHKRLQFYNEKPPWLMSVKGFKSFDFAGRRLMLPAIVNGKELELFYDSGCSAFGLITSKNRFDAYTTQSTEEIRYNANRFGDQVPVCHKNTNMKMEMGGQQLPLKRVSYIDMYADYQQFMSPFTRVGGWLGNKPFIDQTLILDTKNEAFIIYKSLVD